MERFDCLLREKGECYWRKIGGNCLGEMWEKVIFLDCLWHHIALEGRFGSNTLQRRSCGPQIGCCTSLKPFQDIWMGCGWMNFNYLFLAFSYVKLWLFLCSGDTHTHTHGHKYYLKKSALFIWVIWISPALYWLDSTGGKKTRQNYYTLSLSILTSFLVGTDKVDRGRHIQSNSVLISALWEYSYIETMTVIWLWSLRHPAECETTHQNHICK